MNRTHFIIIIIIAAIIVIFSAIFLALTIDPLIDTPGYAEPTLKGTLSAALPSSNVTSSNFSIMQGAEIESGDLTAGQGHLDLSRIYFSRGQFSENQVFVKNTAREGGVIRNLTPGNLKAKALIICRPTGVEVKEVLERVNLDNNTHDFTADLCEEDNQPCCLIVLRKSDNQ